MKYIIPFITGALLFAGCSSDVEVQPTGSFDTLGIHWMTIERKNITYYFQGTGVKGASLYTDIHEEAYEKLAPIFNSKLPKKLRFFVWTDWEQARQIFNPPQWAAGMASPRACICNVRVDISLGHEMTHVLSFWANGVPGETYSRLVTEGVAVAFDLEEDDKIETAKEALSKYSFQSITDFWGDNAGEIDADVFYPVAGAFIDFLYKKNMHEKFFTLIKYQKMEEAENIYGKEELHAMINEFNELVGL